MWNRTPPLIPAYAGTQMEEPGSLLNERSASSSPPLPYAIWVPAFAGMSGILK